MKKNNRLSYIILFIAATAVFISCKKFEPETLPMTPINVGATETYESLDENSTLTIPVKFTSPCDSGIASAGYKVVNNRASGTNAVLLVQSPLISIPFTGKTVDTTINVPVRLGLQSVVVIIYDKAGRMSSKSVNIKNINPSTSAVKTLTDVVMSTDPDDNTNFFSFYEPTPVFGRATALQKQSRIDFIIISMSGGARFIAPHAYGASTDYYNSSKTALTGFTNLSYTYFTSTRSSLVPQVFNSITNDVQLTKYLNDSIQAYNSVGGNNYNFVGGDRRVTDVFTANASINKGFMVGWGYRSHPTATSVVLNEAFGIILIKSVTQKANGHFIMTFDIKAPVKDERSDYNLTPIAPYSPYPL